MSSTTGDDGQGVRTTYLIGDTREQVATIADGSVSLVACSPPFIALRSYLPADHPDKHLEIGSEPDPATFLDTLLQLTAEWGRVLAPWGSIAIELGDTYSSSGSQESGWHRSGDEDPDRYRSPGAAFDAKRNGGANWPRPKCLALVPQLYAASLAYGRNLLTGEESPAGQWLVRNMIVWHRPNPAVGALGDKFRPSTSYITVATRSSKRWFDLSAVRHAHTDPNPDRFIGKQDQRDAARVAVGLSSDNGKTSGGNPAGAPPLDTWLDHHDTWTQTTQPSNLAHYAMWPAKLAERLILSMCPAEVCATCGEPRRRVERLAPHQQRQAELGAHIEQRRRAAGYERRDLAHLFPHYKNTESILAQFSNWERAKNVPSWDDWGILRSAIGVSDEYDDMIEGERVWTTDPSGYVDADGREVGKVPRDKTKNIANGHGGHTGKTDSGSTKVPVTLGWTSCGHDNYIPGTVLDPFAGTFTTGCVAEFHGRSAIGIDIDVRNRAMWPARREEVFRNLNPTHVKAVEGQGELW